MIFSEEWLDNFQKFLAKSDGRDKLGRTIQYGMRMLVGMSTYIIRSSLPINENAREQILHTQIVFRNIQSNLSDARRTHRWFKEISILRILPDLYRDLLKIDLNRWEFFRLVSQSFLSIFFVTDHLAWLRKVHVLRGDSKHLVRYNLRFLFLANFFAIIYQMRLYYVAGEEKDEAVRRKKLTRIKYDGLRCALLCVQNAHNGELYETHDLVSGGCGVISSLYDASKQWPS